MGLRAQARADAQMILTEVDCGFAHDFVVTDPAGLSATIQGTSTDISAAIDPETGQTVEGRHPAVTWSIQSLTDAGFTSLPKKIHSSSSRVWKIEFDDVDGNTFQFTISRAMPDRAIGVITCLLEEYGNG